MPIRSFNGIKPQIDNQAFIDNMATVSGQVVIGKNSSIWPNVSVRGDLLSITIGENTNIQDNSTIHTTQFTDKPGTGFDTIIGDNVTVGHGAIIHGCHIGNRVLIGMGAIILDGAIIDDDVMVAAGSVVPPGKHLKSGGMYVGSPVKKKRALKISEKKYILTNAKNYSEIMIQHKNNQYSYDD